MRADIDRREEWTDPCHSPIIKTNHCTPEMRTKPKRKYKHVLHI